MPKEAWKVVKYCCACAHKRRLLKVGKRCQSYKKTKKDAKAVKTHNNANRKKVKLII